MSFEQNIQNWVSIDNQIKTLSEQIKELRDKKNVITEKSIHIVISNLGKYVCISGLKSSLKVSLPISK